MKNIKLVSAIVLVLLLSIASAENNVTRQDAETAIQDIEDVMKSMKEMNFSVKRINDTLIEARDILQAQELKKLRAEKPNYKLVISQYEEVSQIKENAVKVKDELFSLQQKLNSLRDKNINVSATEKLISQIDNEVRDERYEKALELVPKTRDKIAEIEASNTAARVFYSATKGVIVGFFKENYIVISIVVVIALILYFMFRKKIARFFIKRKMQKLEVEKKALKKLIQKTQKEYFEEGKIPEGTYNVRTNRFGEMIRDIDRQIPLLKERLARLRKQENKEGFPAQKLKKRIKNKSLLKRIVNKFNKNGKK